MSSIPRGALVLPLYPLESCALVFILLQHEGLSVDVLPKQDRIEKKEASTAKKARTP